MPLKSWRFFPNQDEKLRALRVPQIENCAVQNRWAERGHFIGVPRPVMS
jgi:hypothetical protein